MNAPLFAEEAPRLYEAGMNVVPVIPGLKRPTVEWAEWQDRRQKPEEVSRLREAFPRTWIGAVLGPGTGFLDVESDCEAGERALHSLGVRLPDTETWRSQRGPHRLYRCSEPLRSYKRDGFEVRTRGLSVLPPSGRREWLTSGDPRQAARLPEAFVQFLSTLAPPSLVTCFKPLKVPRSKYQGIVGRGRLQGDDLTEMFADPNVVAAMARVLGLHPTAEILGPAFPCVLPGHGRGPGLPEHHPSATLCLNRRGVVVYHDWHKRDGLEYLTLPEVRQALASRQVRKLKGPELATWGLRLLVEAGVLQPVHLDAPALPEGTPAFVRAVDEGFRLLLGCKWLHTPGAPTAFSWRFAAAWCGVRQKEAGLAIHHLLHERRLRIVDRRGKVTLFLPETNDDFLR